MTKFTKGVKSVFYCTLLLAVFLLNVYTYYNALCSWVKNQVFIKNRFKLVLFYLHQHICMWKCSKGCV